jgi:hypothetical protein
MLVISEFDSQRSYSGGVDQEAEGPRLLIGCGNAIAGSNPAAPTYDLSPGQTVSKTVTIL